MTPLPLNCSQIPHGYALFVSLGWISKCMFISLEEGLKGEKRARFVFFLSVISIHFITCCKLVTTRPQSLLHVIYKEEIRVAAVPINGWPNFCCDITPGFLPMGVTPCKHKGFTQRLCLFLVGHLQAAPQTHREEKARSDKRMHRSAERFITRTSETHSKFILKWLQRRMGMGCTNVE